MKIEIRKLSEIFPYEKNARKIPQSAVDAVALSLKTYGWQQPIVVDKKGVIVVGHARRMGALQLGWTEAPVTVFEGTAAQAKAYRLMDNRSHEEATWEPDLLRLELLELKALDLDLAGTGFNSRELDAFLRPAAGNEDDAPPVPEVAVTQPGDLWTLGEHRLLCGNATDADAVKRVCGEARADLVLTDPPYGINIVQPNKSVGGGGKKGNQYPFGGTKGVVVGGKPYGRGVVGGANIVKVREYSTIIGDDKPFDPTALLSLADEQIIFGANFFASKLPDGKAWIVWDKKASGNFSAVELAWTSREGKLRMYEHMWSGLRREGPRDEELRERVHPTQKPVGLFKSILADFSELGMIVLDPYSGSASVLIACEQEKRRCRAMELDPLYCDVAVKRWMNLTGKQAYNQDGVCFPA